MKLTDCQKRALLRKLSEIGHSGTYFSLKTLRSMGWIILANSPGRTRIDLVRAIDRAMGYEVFICLSERNFRLSLEFVCDLLPVGLILDRPVELKKKSNYQQLAKALPGALDQFNEAVAAVCRREGWPGWGEVNEMCEPNEKAAKAMGEAGIDFKKKEKG